MNLFKFLVISAISASFIFVGDFFINSYYSNSYLYDLQQFGPLYFGVYVLLGLSFVFRKNKSNLFGYHQSIFYLIIFSIVLLMASGGYLYYIIFSVFIAYLISLILFNVSNKFFLAVSIICILTFTVYFHLSNINDSNVYKEIADLDNGFNGWAWRCEKTDVEIADKIRDFSTDKSNICENIMSWSKISSCRRDVNLVIDLHLNQLLEIQSSKYTDKSIQDCAYYKNYFSN